MILGGSCSLRRRVWPPLFPGTWELTFIWARKNLIPKDMLVCAHPRLLYTKLIVFVVSYPYYWTLPKVFMIYGYIFIFIWGTKQLCSPRWRCKGNVPPFLLVLLASRETKLNPSKSHNIQIGWVWRLSHSNMHVALTTLLSYVVPSPPCSTWKCLIIQMLEDIDESFTNVDEPYFTLQEH